MGQTCAARVGRHHVRRRTQRTVPVQVIVDEAAGRLAMT
jgi:hypothetical protein